MEEKEVFELLTNYERLDNENKNTLLTVGEKLLDIENLVLNNEKDMKIPMLKPNINFR